MAAIVFDVRAAEKRLLEAGASESLARTTADLMAESVLHNLDQLVTKDIMNARFAEQDARIDARFAGVNAKLQFLMWCQAIIGAAVLIPLIQSWLIG